MEKIGYVLLVLLRYKKIYQTSIIILFSFTETINSLDAEQDDTCILNIIRNQFLNPPSTGKLNLDNPEIENPSMGQAQAILEILNNKV